MINWRIQQLMLENLLDFFTLKKHNTQWYCTKFIVSSTRVNEKDRSIWQFVKSHSFVDEKIKMFTSTFVVQLMQASQENIFMILKLGVDELYFMVVQKMRSEIQWSFP